MINTQGLKFAVRQNYPTPTQPDPNNPVSKIPKSKTTNATVPWPQSVTPTQR